MRDGGSASDAGSTIPNDAGSGGADAGDVGGKGDGGAAGGAGDAGETVDDAGPALRSIEVSVRQWSNDDPLAGVGVFSSVDAQETGVDGGTTLQVPLTGPLVLGAWVATERSAVAQIEVLCGEVNQHDWFDRGQAGEPEHDGFSSEVQVTLIGAAQLPATVRLDLTMEREGGGSWSRFGRQIVELENPLPDTPYAVPVPPDAARWRLVVADGFPGNILGYAQAEGGPTNLNLDVSGLPTTTAEIEIINDPPMNEQWSTISMHQALGFPEMDFENFLISFPSNDRTLSQDVYHLPGVAEPAAQLNMYVHGSQRVLRFDPAEPPFVVDLSSFAPTASAVVELAPGEASWPIGLGLEPLPTFEELWLMFTWEIDQGIFWPWDVAVRIQGDCRPAEVSLPSGVLVPPPGALSLYLAQELYTPDGDILITERHYGLE